MREAIEAVDHELLHLLRRRMDLAEEVAGAQQAIQAGGADPRPLFRFPFGDRDARTIAVVNDLGYLPVRWTVDTLGWKGTSGGLTAQQVSDRAVDALRPGAIVLMHVGSNPDDGTTLDADALPGMIDRMRAAGDRVRVRIVANQGHVELVTPDTPAWAAAVEAIEGALD